MSIDALGVTPAQTASVHAQTPAAGTEPKKTFDQETFLALLVAQLRYQDPSSPMDTNEMMAQSTQMASMEQLVSIGDTSRESFALQMRVAASAMVGQEVTFLDADGKTQTGTVTGVDFSTGVPSLTVGEWTVPLDAISSVATKDPGADDPTTDPGEDDKKSANDQPVNDDSDSAA